MAAILPQLAMSGGRQACWIISSQLKRGARFLMKIKEYELQTSAILATSRHLLPGQGLVWEAIL
jgi:hypothetical protein